MIRDMDLDIFLSCTNQHTWVIPFKIRNERIVWNIDAANCKLCGRPGFWIVQWGVWDTVKEEWLGTQYGPTILENQVFANAVAEVVCQRFNHTPGRYVGKVFFIPPSLIRTHAGIL